MKVSVIIATFNRFKYLLNAINSVKNQTYKDIEIIIINDCSTDENYYKYNFKNCIVIHLDMNSKKRLGHKSPGGYQRSIGMKIASGDYIAFLDDDDYWLPNKLEMQVKAMKDTKYLISCTDGYFGKGIFEKSKVKEYKIYNKEKYYGVIKNIFKKKGKEHLLENGFPKFWNKEFINVHNCSIASSVMINKKLVSKIGYFSNKYYAPDYDYWLRAIEHSDLLYLDLPLMYYDVGHGDGQNY